jgi:hypothetical protein
MNRRQFLRLMLSFDPVGFTVWEDFAEDRCIPNLVTNTRDTLNGNYLDMFQCSRTYIIIRPQESTGASYAFSFERWETAEAVSQALIAIF